MNIRKKLVTLAILGATSLFAANLTEINILVDQINHSKDAKVKEDLLIKLQKDVETLNQKDYLEAQSIIETKLKPVK